MNARIAILLVVSLCACGSEVVHLNRNNGANGSLSFDPKPAALALGGSFTFNVSRMRAGAFECDRTWNWSPSRPHSRFAR